MQGNQSKWYAIYTKPRWEKKVAHLLSKKQIEHYCPLTKVQRQWSDRKKIIEVPLFTSYVFVHIPLQAYSIVRKTPGIINFVYWLKKPAVIMDKEIETIKQFLDEYENVQVEQTKVCVKDQVRVLNGPFFSKEGKVVEVMNQSIKVLLPSLGFALVATVDKLNIEMINTIKNKSTLVY